MCRWWWSIPPRCGAFAQAIGKRARTAPIDAMVITRFVQAARPEVRPLADAATRLPADLVAPILVTRRCQIVQMIGAGKQREKRIAEPRLRRSIARLTAALQKELTEVDGEIDEQVRASPAWRPAENLLRSVPGVGPVIARTLIAGLPEPGVLDRRQIAALAGLAPFTRQSGRWKGKSFIAGGRASVRTALFMAALVATRHNPTLSLFHQRLISAGKARLLAILTPLLRDNQPWLTA